MMNDLSFITTSTGRYYAGMTLQDARAKDLEKSWWRRDFRNIDKNKDGYLSADEIILENKRDAKMNTLSAAIWLGCGVLDFFMEKSKSLALPWLAIDAGFVIGSLATAINVNRKTKQYEEYLAKNHIEPPKINMQV